MNEPYLTQVDEVCVLDVPDLVEATIEMCCVFGEGGDLFQLRVITVHTSTQTHTQQACRHTFRQSKVWAGGKPGHTKYTCLFGLFEDTHPGHFPAQRGLVP